MNKLNGKQVKLKLVGLDSNAFSVMGAWRSQARKEGWTAAEIKIVLEDVMSSDYNHLLAVIQAYTK